ncbi:MAG: DUF5615 family PIN-like protein [Segetibacter sp.]|nr:DUF5615 family PIN-like protein [Segetibacter sp.]
MQTIQMQFDVLIIDAQLPPSLIPFFRDHYNIKAVHVNELEETLDEDIFLKARKINGWILKKDNDFVAIVKKLKAPPKIFIIEYGNVGKARLKELLLNNFSDVLGALQEHRELDYLTIK